MRKGSLIAVLLLTPLMASRVQAQKPLAVEAGVFGQFTKTDKELSLDDVLSIGGRLGLFLLPNLGIRMAEPLELFEQQFPPMPHHHIVIAGTGAIRSLKHMRQEARTRGKMQHLGQCTFHPRALTSC